jgi:hypothetical protein
MSQGAGAVAGFEDVCLIIATFKQDAAVIALLDGVYAAGPSPFARIIVVDSMGSGAIQAHIEAAGWEGVDYHSADHNLGSAGNLAMRLELASATGARWAYAINHDGEVQVSALEALVERGRAAEASGHRVGALYPLRFTTRLGKYNLTGRSSLPIPYVGTRVRPTRDFPVWWASSNGALYNLEPVRLGLVPWADLWMGWEDLGYGWLLARNLWEQRVVVDAVFEDSYEYRSAGAGKASVQITDKPTWYAYYQLRNLILVTRRNERGAATWAVVAGRAALEFGLTGALRPDKLRRARFLMHGLVDGLLDKAGKWQYP